MIKSKLGNIFEDRIKNFAWSWGITKSIITTNTSQKYYVSTRDIYIKLFLHKSHSLLGTFKENFKKLKKTSSIIKEKLFACGWLGGITLGSDMTKDLFLSCFSFSHVRFTVCDTISLFRSSYLLIFFKNCVLKNFATFTGKHLSWSLFIIKLQAWRPATY